MYAHLNEQMKREGEEIKQKEIVAKSGNTGLSTGAHLHYSIWYKGEIVDPIRFVSLKHTEDVKKEYEQRGEVLN